MLAIQYGVGSETLAGRLGISSFEANEMIVQHRELFAIYWRWAEDWLARALDAGVMWTPFDWQCRTGITEFNQRSVINFPVQATASDALRIAIAMAERHGLKLLAPIHDALLVEAPIERIEADVALLREIMRRASRVVLNATAAGTLELRTDAKIVRHPDCYTDNRGAAIWAGVLKLLADYRAQAAADGRRIMGG
jgi:DNA polymerase-1